MVVVVVVGFVRGLGVAINSSWQSALSLDSYRLGGSNETKRSLAWKQEERVTLGEGDKGKENVGGPRSKGAGSTSQRHLSLHAGQD